jgi:hypothetical protein
MYRYILSMMFERHGLKVDGYSAIRKILQCFFRIMESKTMMRPTINDCLRKKNLQRRHCPLHFIPLFERYAKQVKVSLLRFCKSAVL